MKKYCVIGVDLGTTSAKATAFNESDEVISTASKDVQTYGGPDGRAEQDPDEVAAAALHVLADVSKSAAAKGYEARLVGFSAAMHSLIPLGNSGAPLARAMIWMDARPDEEAMRLRATEAGRRLYQRTGTPIHAMSPLVKLLWLQRIQPDWLPQAARFASLKEFVWAKWFDEWVIDESMAGATGMYSLETRSWDPEALAMAGVQIPQLSRIVPSTYTKQHPVSARLQEAGLSNAVFNIGGSDGVLANLGVGATNHESMVLTIGTSCAVRITTSRPYFDPVHQPFCYLLDENHYVVGGPSNSGGVVIDWLANTLLTDTVDAKDHVIEELLEQAESVETGNLICLPYVAGERAPLWNAHRTGAILGLQLHHGPAHVFRATLEGVLMNAYWIAEPLLKSERSPKQLVASGKLLENDFVRQLCSDIFNLPVAGCEDADASVRGAVAVAKLAVGEVGYEQIAHAWAATDLTLPDANRHTRYMQKYAQYRTLCDALTIEPTVQSTVEAEVSKG